MTRKRTDGFHDLETLFYPIPVKDALEIVNADKLTIRVTGLDIDDTGKNNLCIRAWELLKNDFPALPPVNIHLYKAIPAGAGLGGGSADGASMLIMLNRKFGLDLSQEKLIEYALQLGSDCPFFIVNTPCLATGRGEQLLPIELDLTSYKLVLVNPGIHISTKEAFQNLVILPPEKSIAEITREPVQSWKGLLKNDFETTVFERYPAIKDIKEHLYNAGAVYASMSGTGSTVFGFFYKQDETILSFPPNYWVRELK